MAEEGTGDDDLRCRSADANDNRNEIRCFFCEAPIPSSSQICDFCHAFLYADLTVFDGDSGDSGNEDADSLSSDSRSNVAGAGDDVAADLDGSCCGDAALQQQQAVVPVSREKLGELTEAVPPEVLMVIFGYLDDLGKWACSRVSKRWNTVLASMVDDSDWRGFIRRRWPLFSPQYKVQSHQELYCRLVQSSFCFRCLGVDLFSSASLRRTGQRRSAHFIRPLWAEVRCLRNDAPDGIAALPLVDSRTVWTASITGPVGSPYEGGVFFLSIRIPANYPIFAPRVLFLTRIYHPNVSLHGDIGVDLFSRAKWSVAVSLSKLLISIQSLLTDPYPQLAMHPQAARLYMADPPAFERTARQWTWQHAMLDYLPRPSRLLLPSPSHPDHSSAPL